MAHSRDKRVRIPLCSLGSLILYLSHGGNELARHNALLDRNFGWHDGKKVDMLLPRR